MGQSFILKLKTLFKRSLEGGRSVDLDENSYGTLAVIYNYCQYSVCVYKCYISIFFNN